MGGYVGKLFQEFAVTITASLLLSLVISLTLTPMMCARLLKDESRRKHGRLYLLFERGFDGLLALYARGLRVVLRHRFVTLLVMLSTIALTGYLYVIIPKGFFPQQDTGQIVGITEAAQDISFPAMSERQQAVVDILSKDPAIQSVASYIGPGGPTATLNQGRIFIVLKPKPERKASADQVIARLEPQLAHIQGIKLYMQSAQDITIGARLSKTQYQYTLTDADSNELNHWSAIFLEKIRALDVVADVASDQANAGPRLQVTVNREVASSFGILPTTIDNTLDDAFGQRIVSTMFTSLNQYHVVMEVDPAFQYGPDALKDIYLNSATGTTGPSEHAGPQRHHAGADSDQSPGPVSLGDDLVQPATGRSAGRCGDGDPEDREGHRQARLAVDLVPGQRASLPVVPVRHAVADRGGADRDLHHPRRPL
ncbi:multidrug efflux pump subunit AcrB [Bradyrhizobium sp. i1.3.1]